MVLGKPFSLAELQTAINDYAPAEALDSRVA
jgi:hypothetical protein